MIPNSSFELACPDRTAEGAAMVKAVAAAVARNWRRELSGMVGSFTPKGNGQRQFWLAKPQPIDANHWRQLLDFYVWYGTMGVKGGVS
jgi:hypothetical protein